MELLYYGTAGAVQTVDNDNISFAVVEGASTVLVEASGSPARNLLKSGIETLFLCHFNFILGLDPEPSGMYFGTRLGASSRCKHFQTQVSVSSSNSNHCIDP